MLDKNVTFPFSLQRKKIVRVKVTHVGKGSFNNEKISDLNEGFNRFCFVVFTFDSMYRVLPFYSSGDYS